MPNWQAFLLGAIIYAALIFGAVFIDSAKDVYRS